MNWAWQRTAITGGAIGPSTTRTGHPIEPGSNGKSAACASRHGGRAVAYQRDGRHRQANTIFEELAAKDKKVIAYHIGLAQTQLELEHYRSSQDTFDRAIELFPRNVPLVIHYAEALLRLGEAEQAHEILLDLLNNVPPTPGQVQLIARAASAPPSP